MEGPFYIRREVEGKRTLERKLILLSDVWEII